MKIAATGACPVEPDKVLATNRWIKFAHVGTLTCRVNYSCNGH
jgi:hypothetical protein